MQNLIIILEMNFKIRMIIVTCWVRVINKENNRAWQTAENIAYQILAFDKWKDVLEGATHYHADYVNPKWNKTMKKIVTIDTHIFYKRS